MFWFAGWPFLFLGLIMLIAALMWLVTVERNKLKWWIALAATAVIFTIGGGIVMYHNDDVWHRQLPEIAAQQHITIATLDHGTYADDARYEDRTIDVYGHCTIPAKEVSGKIVLDGVTPTVVLTGVKVRAICG